MKKIYFLAMAVCAFAFTTNAQIIDDTFEFYNTGDMGTQAPGVWRTWSGNPGGSEDLQVVDDNSNSGDQAGFVGDNGIQDVILELGNQTSGSYGLGFMMYIPAGATGYYNVQGEIPAGAVSGVFNSSNIYFNQDGTTPGEGLDQTDGSTFTFPEDTWFMVRFDFDVDNLTYVMYVDGSQVNGAPVAFQADSTLGGIDFFSVSANNQYWLDDVFYQDGFLGSDDFDSAVFSVYPNPVQDVLNINTAATVDAITVYDVLGKIVLQAQPDSVSPSIDMSALTSGAYMVKVTIGGSSKTVKVVK